MFFVKNGQTLNCAYALTFVHDLMIFGHFHLKFNLRSSQYKIIYSATLSQKKGKKIMGNSYNH